tara:strand:- start:11206 stop:13578 length:2373 start_codon:yes stop_codon:yes gene_type:complete
MSTILIRHKLTVFGGAELVLLKQANYLIKNNTKVTIVSIEISDVMKKKLKDNNINYYEINKNNLISIIYLRNFIKKNKCNKIIVHENSHIHVFLATLFLKSRIQIIQHLYGSFIWLLGSKLNYSFFYRKKIKVILDQIPAHKTYQNNLNFKLPLFSRIKIEIQALLDYLSVRSFNHIVTCSPHIKKELQILYNINAAVIPGGVDQQNLELIEIKKLKKIYLLEFGFNSNTKIILTINRLDKRKRIDLLIRTFYKLQKVNKDIVLIIIGTGEEKDNLLNLVDDLKLNNKVFFTGFVSDEIYKKYLVASEVIAYPAWCAWGLVPLESLAHNKKTIVSNDAMIFQSVADLENTEIFNPDEDSLLEALKIALTKKDFQTKDFINNFFSWEIFFKTIFKLFEKEKKLLIINSHPVNYHTPIYKQASEIDNVQTKILFLLNVFKDEFNENNWPIDYSNSKKQLLTGYDYKFIKNYAPITSNSFFGLLNFGIILEIIKYRPQLVLVFGWMHLILPIVIFLSFFLKYKIILKGEADLINKKNTGINKLAKNYLKILFMKIDFITYSYKKNMEYFLDKNIKSNKLYFFPCAVDNSYYKKINNELNKFEIRKKFLINNNEIVALYVGRFDSRKRILYLLYIFSKCKFNSFVKLYLIGDGDLKNDVINYVNKNNWINKKVIIESFKNQYETCLFYKMSDFVVLPSIKDPSPKVLNEALNFNLPSLISDNIGTADDLIINEYNGLIFRTFSENDFIYKFEKLVNNKNFRLNLSKNCTKTIEKWSIEEDINVLKKLIYKSNND